MNITNILKGVGGEYESTRVLGAFGVIVYIIIANGLMLYQCWYLQKPFDITAYCLAFPAGLGTAIAAVGITAGVKDRNVAAAQTVTNTGSQPAIPPAPPAPINGELSEEDRLP
jgi:hypothetical protein